MSLVLPGRCLACHKPIRDASRRVCSRCAGRDAARCCLCKAKRITTPQSSFCEACRVVVQRDLDEVWPMPGTAKDIFAAIARNNDLRPRPVVREAQQ